MGHSLSYPVPSSNPARGGLVSLHTYDLIDVWWVNAVRTGFLGSLATIGLYSVVILLFLGFVLAVRELIKWSRSAHDDFTGA